MNPQVTPISQPKPRVRVRTHLTSFQLSKDQKQVIDQAYQLFTAESGQFVNKGDFIEGLALDYMKKSGGRAAATDMQPQENML